LPTQAINEALREDPRLVLKNIRLIRICFSNILKWIHIFHLRTSSA